VPPVAVTFILPLFPPPVVGLPVDPVTVIVTPAQGLGAVNVKLAVPEQPLLFFAVIVKLPAPRPVKLPEA